MAVNVDVYRLQLTPLFQKLDNLVTNYAVPLVPVDSADPQLDIDLANISRERLRQQRASITEGLASIDLITQQWQEYIQTLARAARNPADAEFTAYSVANNTLNIRGNAGARVDAINDMLADLDIYIIDRRRALPALAAAPPPAALPAVPDDLSKLEVTKFSGDRQSDWFEWLGHFNSAIGGNVRLTNLRKFVHLKAIMDGEAATLVDRETLMFSMKNGDSTAKRLNDVSRNQKHKSGSYDSNRQW